MTPQEAVEVFTPAWEEMNTPAWQELNTPPMEEMSMISPTQTRANRVGWRRIGNSMVEVSIVSLQVCQQLLPDFIEQELEITEGWWYAAATTALAYTVYVRRYFILSIWRREPIENIVQNGFALLTCLLALWFGYSGYSDSQSLTVYRMVILCQMTLATFVS